MRELWRVALWGMAAAASLTIAIFAGSTEAGTERLHVAALQVADLIQPSGYRPPRPLDAAEGRRLAETVRILAADRERLVTRIATLEQGVDEVSGSVARVEKLARLGPGGIAIASIPANPIPGTSMPAVISAPVGPPPEPAEAEVTGSIDAPDTAAPISVPRPQPAASVAVPVPAPQPQPTVVKREFGLDLGSAPTVEQLRAAWTAAVQRHGAQLEGLNPIVHQRNRNRSGPPDFRLIAGPIPNAATAARLCGAIAAAGGICQPALFDGQRLAVR